MGVASGRSSLSGLSASDGLLFRRAWWWVFLREVGGVPKRTLLCLLSGEEVGMGGGWRGERGGCEVEKWRRSMSSVESEDSNTVRLVFWSCLLIFIIAFNFSSLLYIHTYTTHSK